MPYSWIFIVFFLLETLSVVLFASWLGGLATIVLMVLFFLAGIFMLRHIGISAFLLSIEMVRSRTAGVSFYQMLWPVRYAFAALCFLLPGFFSNLIGLLLLLPFKGKAAAFTPDKAHDNIIDGEFSEINPGHSPDNSAARARDAQSRREHI